MITTLTVTRGDTKEIGINAKDEAGDPLDLGLVEDIFFTVKSRIADSDDDAVIAKSLGEGIEIDSAPDGTAIVTVDPADTAGLSQMKGLHWDVQIVMLTGKVFTLDSGLMNILADVTRRTTV